MIRPGGVLLPAVGLASVAIPFPAQIFSFLPEVAGIPGGTLVVTAVFSLATWWLVYLLFSMSSRVAEEEKTAPTGDDALHPEPASEPAPWTAGALSAEPSGEAAASAAAVAGSSTVYVPGSFELSGNPWGDDFPVLPDIESGAGGESSEPEPGALPADVAVLDRLDERLASCATIEASLELAVDAVLDATGAPAVAVWLDGLPAGPAEVSTIGEFRLRTSRQSGLLAADESSETDARALFEPWASALAAGEAACIPDCGAEPDLSGKLRPEVGSLALAPFSEEGAVRGVLAVAWPSALQVRERQLGLVRRLAKMVGLALECARLREDLAARQTQARVLMETGLAVGRARDLPGTFSAIVHVVHGYLGYQTCAVMLLDRSKRELYVASMAGYDPEVQALRVPFDGPSVTATAARDGRVINVPDVTEWPGYVCGSQLIRSELAIPLIVDGQGLGVLDIESDQPAAFGRRDRLTLEAVATEAALALAHSQLVAEVEERAARLQVVDELARALSTTLDVRSLFQIVVERVRAAIGCDRATLVEFDLEASEARLAAVSSARAVADLELHTAVPLSELTEEEWRGRELLYLAELGEQGRIPALLLQSGFHSLVRVPLHIDGKVAGAFVASSLRPHGFTTSQVATLAGIGPHIAAAMRNARLHNQVQQSYQRLHEAHAQLVQSEQLRVLGEMASGVAHNFNNVLGAILGRAQLVRGRIDDPRLAHEISIIEQAATDGAATVRRLQEFTRLRTDREFVPVDLSQIARDALALTRPWWKDRPEREGIRYGIVTDLADPAWVEGQAHELREVVMNVILNAVEAMPGGGSLTVRSGRVEGRITLEITDTGVGMSDEVRSRIFHPFYSTKGPRGTGLGLSIAYGIVQRHGGELEVESRLGAGTTVRLSLPAGARTGIPATVDLVPAPFQARILVVEDEPAIASLLEELLEGAGYAVVVARTGREAVERLLEGEFHVVLTDLGMPEMSGWELARHCRDLYPGLPVVLVTGWGVELDGSLVTESGVRGVIPKPFSVSQVLEVLARVLESADPSEEKLAA